ncbi:innexin unc-9-like [Dreissena polymorpha]|uniref:Innexin n=1 Tax=Dreissena polymorpha TaxID=45954 RepID=A0A9D4KCZ9_DREPO|nr:innexin unc-9-like [Dreissena polymorpha]KAH3837577.1 hypothetical protein DPMN_110972 [Dreissena polymorpha]
MPTISKGLSMWLFGRTAVLDDFSDRLNHVWTFGLLILIGCIVSWRQMFEHPIRCWCPPEFTHSMVIYTETQCWNSYYIVHRRDEFTSSSLVPLLVRDYTDASSQIQESTTTFTLYQWLPLILCLQALLFKLPHILFYIFHVYSGISFDKISDLTAGYEHKTLVERSVLAKQVARYVSNWCRHLSCLPWRWLSVTWLIVKILYVVNVVEQLVLVQRLMRISDSLGTDSQSYGYTIINNLLSKNQTMWKSSPAFPRKVFCEMKIRYVQNEQMYMLQCNLPSNTFNEAAYVFIWVWLLFVTVVTCTSLGTWILRTIIPVPRNRYISRMMELSANSSCTRNDVARLSSDIGEDGVIVLKLIAANSSELFVADVVHNMTGTVDQKHETAVHSLENL